MRAQWPAKGWQTNHLFVSSVLDPHSEEKSLDLEGAQLKPQRKYFLFTGCYFFSVKKRLDSDPRDSVWITYSE